MRFSLTIPLLLSVWLLTPSPATALPAVFSVGLDLLLGQGRSLLITAARTQAAAAFFQGLDETKACLSEEGRNRAGKDTANCFVGPLRAVSGAYLFSTDVNRYLFGTAKNAKDTAARQAARFVARAAAAVYLFKSDAATWARDPETWRRLAGRVRAAANAARVAGRRFREGARRAARRLRKNRTVLWMADKAGRVKRNRNISWIFGDTGSQAHMKRRVHDAASDAKRTAERGSRWVRKAVRDTKSRWQQSNWKLF